MKKILMLALFLLFLLLSFTSCSSNDKIIVGIDDYMPYDAIPGDYTLEAAKADGAVVHEDGSITSGQAEWDEFVSRTESGTPCMIRLAFYYTLGDPSRYSPEHYEEIKDDYPQLYIQDLSFNGDVYTLYSVEDGQEYIYERKYLKRFDETKPPESAIFSAGVYYYIVNDNNITYEEIVRSMFSSSDPSAFLDCKKVYSKLNYK